MSYTKTGIMRRHGAAAVRPPLIEQPGHVAVVSSDRLTFQTFAHCLTRVEMPRGSRIGWLTTSGGGLAGGRNELVRDALTHGAGWVWFIDDDHVFAPSTLMRLLAHNVDLVQPLVVLRQPPHTALVHKTFKVWPEMTDQELLDAHYLAGGDPPVLDHLQRGLVEVGQAGTGGLLISIDVLKTLKDPWFEWGKFGPIIGGEDTWFTICARRAGFRCWVDFDVPIGHLQTTALWPTPANVNGKVGSMSEIDFTFAAYDAHLR